MADRGDSLGPNVRSIVIVGTTGREKIISEQLKAFGREEIISEQPEDFSREIISEQLEGFGREEIISKQLEGSKKDEVVCISGIFDHPGALKHLDDLSSNKFLREVHLVLFVITYGRINEEKKETIENICKVHPCIPKISALLLVGCEGMSKAAREKILEKFCSVPFTKNVVDFMQKGIYTVGFPNISEVSPRIKEMIAKDMKKDAECLRQIVMNQNSSVDLREIFSKPEGQSTQEMIGLQQNMMKERTASLKADSEVLCYVARHQNYPIAVGDVFKKKNITKVVVRPLRGYTPLPSPAEQNTNIQKLEERVEEQTKETKTLKTKVRTLEADLQRLRAEFQVLKVQDQSAPQTPDKWQSPKNHVVSPSAGVTSKAIVLDSKPRLAELSKLKTRKGESVNIIESLAPQWKQFGVCLDFDPTGRQLDLIEAEHTHEPRHVVTCCREMFKHWLEGNGVQPVTWRRLIELLDHHKELFLVKQIEECTELN